MPDRTPATRPLLRVGLLGRLSVRTATGIPVHLGGRHAPALFAVLAIQRRPRSREAVAADLWPEGGGASAGSLRQALWLIRRGLCAARLEPEAILDILPDSIALREGGVIAVDLDDLERAFDAGDDGLERAIALYAGDLVEALGHDCFAAERERLADRYEDALVAVAERRLRAGDASGARRAAEQALARDPLREEAHATLIAVHGLIGSRSQVVRQYRRLRLVLGRELGETPLPETDAAYRAAMLGTLRRSQEDARRLEPGHRPTLVALGR